MRLRALAVTTALALAATGLTACTSKIGLAATVRNHHLTTNDVGRQVKRGAAPYRDRQSGAVVYPTSFAVEAWIQDQLFGLALSKRTDGRAPKPADVRQIDDALSAVIGTDAKSYFRATFGRLGYTSSFGDLLLHQQETVLLLAHSFEPTASAEQLLKDLQGSQSLNTSLLRAVSPFSSHVSVSARYGAWNPKTLALSTAPGAGLPSFVTIGSDTQATAAPVAGQ